MNREKFFSADQLNQDIYRHEALASFIETLGSINTIETVSGPKRNCSPMLSIGSSEQILFANEIKKMKKNFDKRIKELKTQFEKL